MKCTADDLKDLLGSDSYHMYKQIDTYIMDNYNVSHLWDNGGKYGEECLRYSRNGKTLCTLYFRQMQLGVWIILGKNERNKFDEIRNQFSPEFLKEYDLTKVFHDGKWLMFDVENDDLFDEIALLLNVKKSPNKKLTMCGYCCDMCKAYAPNIKRNDERDILSAHWLKYYDLDISLKTISCDGCMCMKTDAHRIDNECLVRVCVLDKRLSNCSECKEYPCDTFLTRKGLSYEEACQIQELDIECYYSFLGAYDNKSILDRKKPNK